MSSSAQLRLAPQPSAAARPCSPLLTPGRLSWAFSNVLCPVWRSTRHPPMAASIAFISRWSTMNHRIVSTLWQTVGVEMMAETNSKFEIASRLALTQFLVNSNFFQVTDPRAEPIVYVGQPSNAGCTNPFANLDPP
jgi:hypothetical protein